MKIACIDRYNLSRSQSINRYQPVFKAELWTDGYELNSIFALQEEKDKSLRVDSAYFTDFKASVGSKNLSEPFKSMKINSLSYLGNNCYKGGLTGACEYIKLLMNNGIKSVIILCQPSECNIIEACDKNSMPCSLLYIPMECVPKETDRSEIMSRFSRWSFVGALKNIRNGGAFIGCESGNLRTKRFLAVAKLLDPKFNLDLGKLEVEKGDYIFTKWIYDDLTEAQKTVLNYTPEFEKALKSLLSLHV